ncbi:hypothetical protein CC2G_004748 [Coprinopsis cinerea AmutBmut pab1-1]|nr:hypothetical protein CC2G_004748 [Coprinopsis cinerea AmutBmut pab1-1]
MPPLKCRTVFLKILTYFIEAFRSLLTFFTFSKHASFHPAANASDIEEGIMKEKGFISVNQCSPVFETVTEIQFPPTLVSNALEGDLVEVSLSQEDIAKNIADQSDTSVGQQRLFDSEALKSAFASKKSKLLDILDQFPLPPPSRPPSIASTCTTARSPTTVHSPLQPCLLAESNPPTTPIPFPIIDANPHSQTEKPEAEIKKKRRLTLRKVPSAPNLDAKRTPRKLVISLPLTHIPKASTDLDANIPPVPPIPSGHVDSEVTGTVASEPLETMDLNELERPRYPTSRSPTSSPISRRSSLVWFADGGSSSHGHSSESQYTCADTTFTSKVATPPLPSSSGCADSSIVITSATSPALGSNTGHSDSGNGATAISGWNKSKDQKLAMTRSMTVTHGLSLPPPFLLATSTSAPFPKPQPSSTPLHPALAPRIPGTPLWTPPPPNNHHEWIKDWRDDMYTVLQGFKEVSVEMQEDSFRNVFDGDASAESASAVSSVDSGYMFASPSDVLNLSSPSDILNVSSLRYEEGSSLDDMVMGTSMMGARNMKYYSASSDSSFDRNWELKGATERRENSSEDRYVGVGRNKRVACNL